MLIKLNNLIEKKFQKNSKQISENTKSKIKLIFFVHQCKSFLIKIFYMCNNI